MKDWEIFLILVKIEIDGKEIRIGLEVVICYGYDGII